MKRIVLAVALVMLFSGYALASDYGLVEDTLLGKNDSAPMLNEMGVAHIWNKGAKAELETKVSYTSSVRSLTENNSVLISNILHI